MSLHALAPANRPRERLKEKGAQALSDAELLALILRTGNPKENVIALANGMLTKNDIPTLSRFSIEQLSEIPGIGLAKASQLVACFEFSRRMNSYPQKSHLQVNSSSDIAQKYISQMSFLPIEKFIVIYLNSRRSIIKEETIAAGTNNSLIINPKDIFYSAIVNHASAVIVLHNHPSGDPSPSDEDIEFTKGLALAGELLGIALLDHIIIGNNSYVSLREENHFP